LCTFALQNLDKMAHDVSKFTGAGVALVTPFKKDHSVDFDALKKLVKHQIDGGTNFLVVMGTTAESPVLSEVEKNDILKCVIAENAGKLPIVYGIGGNNTAQLLKN
jgi:4-hydroxy-tetrahydrodipicolinate synthase